MSASIKTLLILLCVMPLIFWIGTEIGGGDFVIPGILAILLVGFALNSLLVSDVRYDAFMIGVLSIGYIVGNRGFAQLGPSGSVPVYIGEVSMVACLLYSTMQKIINHHRFIPPFPLGRTLAVYLVFAGLRLAFDVQTYGIKAVRDSAMVYYALFFFIAYEAGQHKRSRRFMEKCLLIGIFLLIPSNMATRINPDIYQAISFRGMPLIYQKGDLVGIFFSLGAILFFCASYHSRRRRLLRLLAAVSSSLMLITGARAGLVALIGPAIFLYYARMRSFLRYQAAIVILAVVGTVVYAGVTSTHLDEMQSVNLFEKYLATLDVNRTFKYQTALSGEISSNNNQFRLVWWQTVISDVVKDSPWLGLGFGYDLAEHFLRSYFGMLTQEGEEVRSPHSYFVSAFGRMGLVGLIFVLMLTYFLIQGCYRAALAVRRGEDEVPRLSKWLGALVIFIGATFGVVLEGPMGGILFWTLLGIACTYDKETAERKKEELLVDPLDELAEPLTHAGERVRGRRPLTPAAVHRLGGGGLRESL